MHIISENTATIILPTNGFRSSLISTLKSLSSQDSQNYSFEVVVVGNGDAARDIRSTCRQCEEPNYPLRIVHEKTPGLLAGRHRGYRESHSEILVFVDDDVNFATSWLNSILNAFEESTVVLVGGPSVPDFVDPPPDWLNRFWHTTPCGGRMMCELSLLELHAEKPIEVDPGLIWGLNYAVRRSTLEECGGFHPDCVPPQLQHFQGDGETGLSAKVAKSGGKAIYHPGAKVFHTISANRMTPEYFDQRYFYQGVCNSFTQIRTAAYGQVDRKPKRTTYHAIRSAVGRVRHAVFGRKNRDLLRERFHRAQQRGFEFHQKCVEMSPALREWVMRDNFFDYQYPLLEPDLVLPERQVHDI